MVLLTKQAINTQITLNTTNFCYNIMSKAKPSKEDKKDLQGAQEAPAEIADSEQVGESDEDWPEEDSAEESRPADAGIAGFSKTPSEPLKFDPSKQHHENIHDMLMKQEEVTWQTIIKELIRTEQMDPWDINISLLAKMFIKTIKKLKELNLNISGKVLLCAALLLRIKSSKLIGDDMLEFDRLLASGENPNELYEGEEGFVEGQLNQLGMTLGKEYMHLIPKTPQPRKRKVSVYDLIDALAVALNVKRRRILNQIQVRTAMGLPEKKIDLSELMDDLYKVVAQHLAGGQATVAFSNLVPGESKHDKIYTFVPLLHLTNARKVDLTQNDHFGEIWVSITKKGQKEDPKADPGYVEEDDEQTTKKKAAKKKRKKKEEKTVESNTFAESADDSEQAERAENSEITETENVGSAQSDTETPIQEEPELSSSAEEDDETSHAPAS